MRTFLAASVLALVLAAPSASAQSLGEVTAATGVHGTLSRQGAGSSGSALDTVKRSLGKSTKPRDLDGFGGSPGKKSGSRAAGKKSVARGSGSGARGSWVTGASAGKGNQSSAWLKGGSGWNAASGRAGASRRPRS